VLRHLFIAIILLAHPSAATAQAPLDSVDFAIGHVCPGLDSVVVGAMLGHPDSVSLSNHPYYTGAKLVRWHYRDLVVHFFATGTIVGITLTTPSPATSRGLHVGDSIARVRALYGEPSSVYLDQWDYVDSTHNRRVVRITLRGGLVSAIYLGWLRD
jgi:hypothetical protein